MDLLADINAALRRLNALNKQADDLETTAHHWIRNHAELAETARYDLEKADHIRKTSVPRLENRIKKLKNAYAAFQTGLLPGIDGDNGVVLEPLK